MTTLASISLSRYSRSIEPTWLAHACGLTVWVWLSHVHCTICYSDARRSPRAEDPGYPHAEIEPPFVYKVLTHTFVSPKDTKH